MRIPHIPKLRANLYYGNYFAVKNIINKTKYPPPLLFKDSMEHGVTFYDRLTGFFETGYVNINKCRNVYVYSEYRRKVLQEYTKTAKVVAVGPYILGADYFHHKDKRNEIKNKFGKLLLVFPVHSLKGIDAEYESMSFIEEIRKVQNEFQSVFVCLHYLDILKNRHRKFLEAGFTIVTAGTREDIKFLSRLKDLIELSDMTMSNGLGSYIGYSICMNRPHYFFYQPVNLVFSNKIPQLHRDFHLYEDMEKQKISLEVEKYFGKFSWNITIEQIEFVQKYWGVF
jgi:hypothetical protein